MVLLIFYCWHLDGIGSGEIGRMCCLHKFNWNIEHIKELNDASKADFLSGKRNVSYLEMEMSLKLPSDHPSEQVIGANPNPSATQPQSRSSFILEIHRVFP